ncbi:hypothetical protein AMAG_10979 [Allomyces macrogynus ATCC 38327]|uniref:Uncharacterized protein n=1 Tax=Allomyces macrogynus (strain ATCC 38327) TaxID=578462 RepID=A0A0L0SS41_ALLM3|nr:hypothetical protein AMAG_10979 [Allomyces macrogynus ATCC 38327]|eukprot:KNE65337.1 hypothetical protein AMAG_10979 [Allomyces macrogynus ATCC 38327]
MIAATNEDSGTSRTTATGTQLTRGSALIAYLAVPVDDVFQGHAVHFSDDRDPTPSAAWTLVGTRATAPPTLHYDTDADADDGWAVPRFYDLVLSDAQSRMCRVQNVVKRAGDNLRLESEYPDLVLAGAHQLPTARATNVGPTAGYFTFTTTTLHAGLDETRPLLERYFPRLFALVRDADIDNAPDVVVCRGVLVTDAPAVLAAYYGDAAPIKEPSRLARAIAECQGDRVEWSDEDE